MGRCPQKLERRLRKSGRPTGKSLCLSGRQDAVRRRRSAIRRIRSVVRRRRPVSADDGTMSAEVGAPSAEVALSLRKTGRRPETARRHPQKPRRRKETAARRPWKSWRCLRTSPCLQKRRDDVSGYRHAVCGRCNNVGGSCVDFRGDSPPPGDVATLSREFVATSAECVATPLLITILQWLFLGTALKPRITEPRRLATASAAPSAS
jgi:hypothetical protein